MGSGRSGLPDSGSSAMYEEMKLCIIRWVIANLLVSSC